MCRDTFYLDTLAPSDTVAYYALRCLAEMFPARHIAQVAGTLAIEDYARAGHCTLTLRESPPAEIVTTWEESGSPVRRRLRNGWYAVGWRGQHFDLVCLQGMEQTWTFILASTAALADHFYDAISEWEQIPHDEVLVFNGYRWDKDEALHAAIQGSTFENLILDGDMATAISADAEGFFAARRTYERYGVPWKRGMLFLGPPGNGKTHAVKAVINAAAHPCLYVKSLPEHEAVHGNAIEAVFAQARRSAPCILVLEDLDSLVSENQRSMLLNELDGFAANSGILTLATTNHAERLDPALIDRPSRFDRKYHFLLPSPAARLAYISRWNASLQPALRSSAATITALGAETEGFSFAYLKELFLSSTMRWMARAADGVMDEVIMEQLTLLKEQMATTALRATHGEPGAALARAG